MSETAAQMENRIAAKFGFPGQNEEAETAEVTTDETTGEVVETEEATGDDLFALEWEGNTYQLPVALKSLAEGAMRTDDYTRKTQEIGEQRRTLEQAQALADTHRLEAQFSTATKDEQQEVALIDSYLKQISSTNWTQLPAEQLMRQHLEISQIKDRRAALLESIEGKRTKFVEGMQAKLTELRGKSREIASKSINGFGEETEKAVREHAKSLGFTEREIDNVLLDPRSYSVLWESAQFRKVKSGTQAAGDKAAKAEKVLRPGVAGARMPSETARKLTYAKAIKAAPSSQAKAQVIEQRLAGIFGRK